MSLQSVIQSLRQHAANNHHRDFLVLKGNDNWLQQQVSDITNANKDALVVSNCEQIKSATLTKHISFKQCRHYLGQESDLVIFHLHQQMTADSLGAISGTIKAGGLLVFLTVDEEPSSQFHLWFWQQIEQNGQRIIRQAEQPPLDLTDSPKILPDNEFDHPYCKTSDQLEAVNAILKVQQGHRNRPLVLTADRGRGKTTAIGIAALELLKQGKHLLLTAPQFASVQVAFDFVMEHSCATKKQRQILLNEGSLSFIPSDKLLQQLPSTDLLLIDEAAAFPVPILEACLANYSRSAFISTIHGYEGSGRGFEVRFKKSLNKLKPEWRQLHINQPIRWAENDPLELMINRMLLLDAEYQKIPQGSDLDENTLCFQQIDQSKLVQQPELLKQVVALLTLAHYKTTPNDLQQLLENPASRLFIAMQETKVLGCNLLHIEGSLDDKLAQQIFQGERRIKGEIIPQSLLFHFSQQHIAQHSFARVVRIAINPELHRQGLGIKLLNFSEQQLESEVDAFGSSFGATAVLASFWQQAGYLPVRLGFNLEASSNERSLLVLKPVKQKLKTDCQFYLKHFHARLIHHASAEFNQLPALLMLRLLRGYQPVEKISELAQQQINSALNRHLPPPEAHYSLKLWLLEHLSKVDLLEEKEQQLLISYLIQQRDISSLIQQFKLSGKADFQRELSLVLTKLNKIIEKI